MSVVTLVRWRRDNFAVFGGHERVLSQLRTKKTQYVP